MLRTIPVSTRSGVDPIRDKPATQHRIILQPNTVATLLELQEYYSERLENAPVSLRDSPYGLKLQAIDELDFSDLEAIEVPLGYGND